MLSALLDPFSFGVDPSEKRTMATKTLLLLLPPRMTASTGPHGRGSALIAGSVS